MKKIKSSDREKLGAKKFFNDSKIVELSLSGFMDFFDAILEMSYEFYYWNKAISSYFFSAVVYSTNKFLICVVYQKYKTDFVVIAKRDGITES
ncbi:MAG: hypothetical protein J5830_00100, partial [Clostridia bacterium]|nr:hypothetical protein [Clostridia bacterium]